MTHENNTPRYKIADIHALGMYTSDGAIIIMENETEGKHVVYVRPLAELPKKKDLTTFQCLKRDELALKILDIMNDAALAQAKGE